MTRTQLFLALSLTTLAACADTAAPEVTTIAITPAVAGEHKAKPLTGAHEVVDSANGKRYRVQMKFENGQQIAQMIWEDGRPIVLSEFSTRDKVKHARNTWYDSTGTGLFITEHDVKKTSVLGRCLRRLVTPAPLYAQTLTNCGALFIAMNAASLAANTYAIQAGILCAASGIASPVCVLAGVKLAGLSAAYLLAKTAYDNCLPTCTSALGCTTGGGGGGFVDPATTKTTTTTGAGSGGCYTTETRVYSLATGQQIGPTTYNTVCK